jgi:D-alanyl-D-alanine carboxypeptidase/D-alanyl-D-alanine-endopeptidase (penicillin-binding protein 4)
LPTVSTQPDGLIVMTLLGEFPRNCTASTSINVLDRTDFADRLFRAMWMEMGGRIAGITREGAAPTTAKLISVQRSRSLAELVRDINKRSDNPMTRMLYLTLGALSETQKTDMSRMATLRRAEQQVRGWMKTRGIDDTGLVIENGSGLSRTERVRPSQLVAVLLAAGNSSWQPEFAASIPIIGVDGAMRQRMHLTGALQQGRIKTGSLRDVAAIAGYLPDALGRQHAVVAMINHPLASAKVARPILDAFMDSILALGATTGH